MAKRRNQGEDDRYFDSQDDPIGLTGAFPVYRDPQGVEYDEGDQSIGLTEAFGRVSGEEDLVHSWDEAGKWNDFNWDAAASDDAGDNAFVETFDDDAATFDRPDAQDVAPAPDQGQDEAEAFIQEITSEEGAASAPEADAGDAVASETVEAAVSERASTRSGGRRAAHVRELSPRMKKSRRTRRVLIVIVILLVLVIGALGYFMYRTFSESQHEAAQQAQQQQEATSQAGLDESKADDTVDAAAVLTDIPKLTDLFGVNTDQAVADLGRGAVVVTNREVKEKNNPITSEVSIALTDEPADSKTGTPTVYLGLNKKGRAIQVGYSASASALGFGSLSFADAVEGEHVVEKTLRAIGANVEDGTVKLPKKSKYSTYASDGTTIVKERCSFEGDVDIDGTPCTWSAVLSYDYTTQIVTGNLSDTVRVMYVYVTEK